MKKTLIAVTALMLLAGPAFAQSYDPDIGSGNITPWNDNMNRPRPNPDQNVGTPFVATPFGAYNSHHGAYAQVPGWYGGYAQVPGWSYGYTAPGVQYDSSGYPIGQSAPFGW